jgi:hypothetical protein
METGSLHTDGNEIGGVLAEVFAVDHPDVVGLLRSGELKAITGHGELELPDGCFLRITPTGRVHTYGLGLSLRRLVRDPLHAEGKVDLRRPSAA